MFCSKCGAEMEADARFCQGCGDAAGERASAAPAAAPIWNPYATANWSLLFSPAFGSYLQMLNWRALGETEKADSARNWFYASLAMLLVYAVVGALLADPQRSKAAAQMLGFIYLLVWYFAAGRSQAKYVKAKFGADYSRRPWGKALLIAVGAFVGYFIVAVIVGVVIGVVVGVSSGAGPAVM